MSLNIKIIALIIFPLWATPAFTQTIATCKGPEGFANYHDSGLVEKKDSGFQEDKITGGNITIMRMQDGKYDILFLDATKTITSVMGQGGQVAILRKGTTDATFMNFYPGMGTIELYTLWLDSEGSGRYDLIQSKGGDNSLIHKSVVMSGLCDSINFDLITQ